MPRITKVITALYLLKVEVWLHKYSFGVIIYLKIFFTNICLTPAVVKLSAIWQITLWNTLIKVNLWEAPCFFEYS